MQSRVIFLFLPAVHVQRLSLAGVVELRPILMPIAVAVFGSEGELLLPLFGRFLAEAVGLFGKGSNSSGMLCFLIGSVDELENVPLLHGGLSQ